MTLALPWAEPHGVNRLIMCNWHDDMHYRGIIGRAFPRGDVMSVCPGMMGNIPQLAGVSVQGWARVPYFFLFSGAQHA